MFHRKARSGADSERSAIRRECHVRLLGRASSALVGTSRRGSLVRVGLAVAVFAVILWVLPARRPGEDGGHHKGHAVHLDAVREGGRHRAQGGPAGTGLPPRTVPRRRVVTLDEFTGNLVVVNFWATWCTPCTTEMPTLETLWRDTASAGWSSSASRVDRGAPRALLAPYVEHHRLTFPILVDPDQVDGQGLARVEPSRDVHRQARPRGRRHGGGRPRVERRRDARALESLLPAPR